MAIRKITDKIFLVGAIDWDRRLFDELIPLPMGTSYNSYLIKGSMANVLIDTVDPSKADELLENLSHSGIDHLDYIVCQHAEQNHSGSIPYILKKFPGSKVLTNEKCKGLLIEHIGLKDEDLVIVKDDEELNLRDISLKFIFSPWVHWPETMHTYFKEENALFSSDIIGSHMAKYNIFSDMDNETELSAKRYFAEIMLPFRNHIRKHLEKLRNYRIEYILPSHGPVHRGSLKILNLYRRWSSDEVISLVLIPYVSMHDSTEQMVKYLLGSLISRGIDAMPINLAESDIGEFAMRLIDASTVIFAAPTVLAGPHPVVAYSALIMNALRPPTKNIGFIGSFGWGGKTEEVLRSLISNIKYNDVGSVFIKGCLKEEGKTLLENMAKKIIEANHLTKE